MSSIKKRCIQVASQVGQGLTKSGNIRKMSPLGRDRA